MKEELFLLNGLNNAEKQEILSLFPAPFHFKKGEIIYSAEKFPNAIGFVNEGKACAVTSNKCLHMKTFDKGTCFGAAAVFNREGSYVSTIKALTDMEVLFLDEDLLRDIFEKYPQTAVNYISFLSDKIRFLNKKLGLLSCQNTEDTVLSYLKSIASEEGIAQLPKNMTLFSKTLGISRASLYRSLDELQKNGHILRQENKVKVINYEKNS